MPGVCGVYGAPGVIGLYPKGEGVPALNPGDGEVWYPKGLGELPPKPPLAGLGAEITEILVIVK